MAEDKIVFVQKKKHIEVFGHGLVQNLLLYFLCMNYKVYGKIGKIVFVPEREKYMFKPRNTVESLDKTDMKQIAEKLHELDGLNK